MKTVLMVDDEPAALRMFEKTFRHDLNVVTAGSADEAIALMERLPVDAVLSDQMMPGRTGVPFLEEVRQRFPSVKVAIVSAYVNFKDAVRLAGFENFITKPYEKADILNLLTP